MKQIEPMKSKENEENEENKELSRIAYMIMYLLQKNDCTDKVAAKTIYELNLMEELNTSRSTISRNIKILSKRDLIKRGAKDEKALSYYVTKEGLEELKTLD